MTNINGIIQEFKHEIQKLYGKRLKRVILYGSRARKEAHNNSDIDLLVVLEREVLPGQEIDRMIDIITEISLQHAVVISVYPVSEQDFQTVQSPLLLNVRKEGVPA